jgi:hypothetical protein
LLAGFKKVTEAAKIFGVLFSTEKVMYGVTLNLPNPVASVFFKINSAP